MADLGQRFVAETLGMMVVISVGNGAIANEVLKKTKGHALGLGFVAIAYGMAFFLAISMFGHISASLNPAMLLAKAFLGRLSWKDAMVLSVANVLGGFLGGVVVYLLYFAHFCIVPEKPSPPRWDDKFVQSSYAPPTHTRNALISYEPRRRSLSDEERQKFAFKYKPSKSSRAGDTSRGDDVEASPKGPFERSNSLQVATILHEHEKARDPAYRGAGDDEDGQVALDSASLCRRPEKFPLGEAQEAHEGSKSERAGQLRASVPLVHDDDTVSEEGAGEGHFADSTEKPHVGHKLRQLIGSRFGGFQLHEVLSRSSGSESGPLCPLPFGLCSGTARKQRAENERIELTRELGRDGITKEDVAVYRGMLVADQNAKLAAFASRPAILNYATNTVAEIICTFFLIWTALMLEERVNLLEMPDAADNLMPVLGPLLIGFLVVALVTAMAGPTGYAANPSRDLGPRIAHFVLPIPNKGPSEWYYALVPIVGPLVGGFLGAAAFYGCIQLNDYPDWFEGETNVFGGSWEL